MAHSCPFNACISLLFLNILARMVTSALQPLIDIAIHKWEFHIHVDPRLLYDNLQGEFTQPMNHS